MRKQVQKERCTKIMLTKCKAVCHLYDKVQLAAAKMLDAEPAIFQFECNVPILCNDIPANDLNLPSETYTTDFVLHYDDGHHPKYGWTITSPALELLDFVEEQGWQDFQMVESLNLLDVLGTLPKGGNSGAGAETRTKKPSSTRKYICPKCSNSCRATKVINLICGDCMEKMVVAE